MLSESLGKVKKIISKLPKKIATMGSFLIKNIRITIIWNYSIIIELFYSSFEIFELYALLIFVTSTNLICLIIN